MDETGGGYTSSDSDVDMKFHDENPHHHQQQHHYQQQQLREDFTSWVHVHWWYSRVEEFVAVANSQHIQAERPEWMKLSNTEGTRLTAWQFIENVMELLAEVAGDRNDHTLAIGSFDHYASIFVRVGHIQTHPFIQECMQALPDDNKPLASFMRRNIGPRPCSFEYDETGGIDVIQILGRLSPNMRRVFA